MLGDGLKRGSRPREMKAREGEFHGLTVRLLFALQKAGRECVGGTKFYCAQDGITADSAILKIF
jgi:hypothetical protein